MLGVCRQTSVSVEALSRSDLLRGLALPPPQPPPLCGFMGNPGEPFTSQQLQGKKEKEEMERQRSAVPDPVSDLLVGVFGAERSPRLVCAPIYRPLSLGFWTLLKPLFQGWLRSARGSRGACCGFPVPQGPL